MAAGRGVADQLEGQAGVAEKAGHRRTAGQKLFRASVYVSQAERMQSAKDSGRNAEYQRRVDLLVRPFELLDQPQVKVAIPYVENGRETSLDRKRVVEEKSVSGRVDHRGGRLI